LSFLFFPYSDFTLVLCRNRRLRSSSTFPFCPLPGSSVPVPFLKCLLYTFPVFSCFSQPRRHSVLFSLLPALIFMIACPLSLFPIVSQLSPPRITHSLQALVRCSFFRSPVPATCHFIGFFPSRFSPRSSAEITFILECHSQVCPSFPDLISGPLVSHFPRFHIMLVLSPPPTYPYTCSTTPVLPFFSLVHLPHLLRFFGLCLISVLALVQFYDPCCFFPCCLHPLPFLLPGDF